MKKLFALLLIAGCCVSFFGCTKAGDPAAAPADKPADATAPADKPAETTAPPADTTPATPVEPAPATTPAPAADGAATPEPAKSE